MSREDDDLSGFADLIEEKGHKRSRQEVDETSNFELYTFLEQNNDIVNKLKDLYGEKALLLKKYPQDISLILKQEGQNIKNRNLIIENMMEKNSGFEKNLIEIFDRHFS